MLFRSQGGNLFSDTSSSGFIAGGSANNKSGGLLPTGTTNLGVSGSASGTASGSNKVTHITLNVGKMGEITLNSIGGLKESAEQIKTVIHQALFEALNDVNTLTAQ